MTEKREHDDIGGYRKIDMRIGRQQREESAPEEAAANAPTSAKEEAAAGSVADAAAGDKACKAEAAEKPTNEAAEVAAFSEAPERDTSTVDQQKKSEASPKAGEEEEYRLDMYGLLRMMFGMCVEQAWIHLGLRLAPGAKETKLDLPQARLAIDTIAYIQQALGDNLSPEEKREVEQTLATLRINYVQRAT